MAKKLGLALGAGGARGAVHIGILRALEEEGIRPDYISGSSMGAVIGAAYANGMTPDEMEDAVLRLKNRDIIDLCVTGFGKRLGVTRSRRVTKTIEKYVGDGDFSDLKIPFCCASTDLLTGKKYVFREGSVLQAVRASSAIPAFFRPVEKDGMLLVDGFLTCRYPIEEVKEMGADVVIVCEALSETRDGPVRPKNVISELFRMAVIMDNNGGEQLKRLCSGITDIVICPEMKGIGMYRLRDLDRAIAEGYGEMKANMGKLRELLAG